MSADQPRELKGTDLASLDPVSQCELAKKLLKEEASQANEELAFQLYQCAAEAGLAAAQYNLADMYLRGAGTAKDIVQAVHWFEKSGEQGDQDALFNLGLIFSEGKGVVQDVV